MKANSLLRNQRIHILPVFLPILLALCVLFSWNKASAVIRDGGIDPSNLGKGGWILYTISDPDTTFGTMKSQGFNYVIIKAGISNLLWTGTWGNYVPPSNPVGAMFNSTLVQKAHAHGLLIFASNRSGGDSTNSVTIDANEIDGEIKVANYCFNQGADGFIWDAESQWESGNKGLTDGPGMAWRLCSTVRSNWPTKFLAHNPYDTLYLHSSYPYKEFGYWSDCTMPQVYHHSVTLGSASAAINWTDVNYKAWQDSVRNLSGVVNGQTVYWSNSIKPLALMRDVYSGTYPDKDVMEFIDYMVADPNCVTAGGYQGFDGYRSELFSAGQIAYIQAATVGNFAGIVNNIVIDEANATFSGSWTAVTTVTCTTSGVTFSGNTGTDTNAFGVTYKMKANGTGAAYAQFSPNIVVPGDYKVYQWHPYRADASMNVPVTINYNGGSANVSVNQQTNGGSWSFIGQFPFAAGATTIRFSDATPDGKLVMADGLKMVFVYPTSVPAAPSNLAATPISTSEIDLTWNDNASNESAYVVSRSTVSGSSYVDIATLGAGAASYKDTGLSSATTYYYVVRAANYVGNSPNSAQASATTLSISPAPVITVQPQSQTAIAGASPALTVTAVGSAPLYYQWYRNGSLQTGATASTFTFNNIQPSQAGTYCVVVTNSYGQAASSNAILSVNFTLTVNSAGGGAVSISPNQSSYAPNTVVSLTAAPGTGNTFLGWSGDATGLTNPLSVTMAANKNIIATFSGGVSDIIIDNPSADFSVGSWTTGTITAGKYGTDYRFANTVSGTATAVATYRPAISTAGFYDVYVWYPQGSNRSTAAPCAIYYNGGSVTAYINETANGGKWVLVASELNFAAGTTGYLTFANNTSDASKVVMADAVRFSYSAVQAPFIAVPPQAQSVKVGASAVFTVAAAGTSLSYQWLFNGTTLAGATQSAYSIASAQTTNAGSYAVRVNNSVANVLSSPANLTVTLPSSPAITSLAVLSGGQPQLQIMGESGVSYLLQSTTDFVSWSTLANLSSSNGLIQFTGSVANLPQCFYRLKVAP